MRIALIFLATQLAAATLTSTPATTCTANGAPCTTVAITPHPSWAAALEGTQWISIAQTGWPLSTFIGNGTVISFSEVFSLASMPSSAMVTFAADDSAGLWLNGSLVLAEASTAGNAYTVCSDFAPTCRSHTSVDVLPWLVAGENTIRFDVAQRGGWSYGLNYAVALTWLDEPPLPTPEPGPRAPLGIGLGCIVGYVYFTRKAQRKAGAIVRQHVQAVGRRPGAEAMTREQLDALEALAEKATPGPWELECPIDDDNPWIVEAGKPTYEWRCLAMVTKSGDDINATEGGANADLLIGLRNNAAALIAAAREALELREALEAISRATRRM